MGRKKKTDIENARIAEEIRKEREANEQDALQYAIPIDEEALNEIDADRAELYVVIKQQLFNLNAMAMACKDLDEHEAAQLQVLKHVRNMKNSITELINYAMLIRMVCENINDDITNIQRARREFKQQILLKIAQAEENARKQAEAIAQAKRDARKKEAGEPETEQAEPQENENV